MSGLEDRELIMLRNAVDRAQMRQGRIRLQDPAMLEIIHIVEGFLRSTKLICYGGTAINNILPVGHQFYDKNTEFPDYDFYSPSAIKDAKELAVKYSKMGFTEVEAKAGVHHGTYKVYVNFVPVADITQLPTKLYKALARSAISIDGIRYAPPDFLRMSMYLELARPDGDVSRWEKVYKRLGLLNKFYPISNPRCSGVNFAREFEGKKHVGKKAYTIIKSEAVRLGLVFFGGFATAAIGGHKSKKEDPDFDLLSETPMADADHIAASLKRAYLGSVRVRKQPGLWEVIPDSYEISLDGDIVCIVYQTIECQNYNVVNSGGIKTNIATFDTMLSLWLAMLYDKRKAYDQDRVYCMAQYLFNLQKKRKLKKRGPLRRFGPDCIGKQKTLESIRAAKGKIYAELEKSKGSPEWDSWFLNYRPEPSKSRKSQPRMRSKKSRRSSGKKGNTYQSR
tara:strand:+ start:3281 stop:4630 length:1350 start_codon:yes stop_codon:yes gene_type:complete